MEGMKTDHSNELTIESCHSTWIFDESKMRFRRVLKGIDLDPRLASTGWRPYWGLEIDPLSDSFVVHLDPSGTRLLRSWRHIDNQTCPECGEEATTELSIEELGAGRH